MNLNYKQFAFLLLDIIKLDWSETSEGLIKNDLKDVDLIIAADIIYDSSLFDSLLTTLRMIFNHCDNCDRFVLVNAVRNPETELEFLTMLGTIDYTSKDKIPSTRFH